MDSPVTWWRLKPSCSMWPTLGGIEGAAALLCDEPGEADGLEEEGLAATASHGRRRVASIRCRGSKREQLPRFGGTTEGAVNASAAAPGRPRRGDDGVHRDFGTRRAKVCRLPGSFGFGRASTTAIESVGALRGAGNVIDFRGLALGDLRRESTIT